MQKEFDNLKKERDNLLRQLQEAKWKALKLRLRLRDPKDCTGIQRVVTTHAGVR